MTRSLVIRRVGLLAAAIGCVPLAACARPSEEPRCHAVPPTILLAESVPSARWIPCVAGLPDGWAVDAFSADDRAGTFTLAHEDGPLLRVVLQRACVLAEDPVADQTPTVGVTQRMSVGDDGGVRWTSTFPGGCVIERLELSPPTAADADPAIHEVIELVAREDLDRELG